MMSLAPIYCKIKWKEWALSFIRPHQLSLSSWLSLETRVLFYFWLTIFTGKNKDWQMELTSTVSVREYLAQSNKYFHWTNPLVKCCDSMFYAQLLVLWARSMYSLYRIWCIYPTVSCWLWNISYIVIDYM